MFANASLAARIERAESTMLIAFADGLTRRDPSAPPRDVLVLPLGGGVAVFAGAGSPLTKVAGLGFASPPTAAELSEVELAFAARGARVQAEVSSLADPAVPRMLTDRGYRLIGFENVLGLRLAPNATPPPAAGPVSVEPIRDDELGQWMDAIATGFMHPDIFDGPPSHETFSRAAMDQVLADTLASATLDRFVARLGGEVAGGASMRVHEGVAQLAGAATRPEYRRQGVQTALLRHRLHDAAQRHADLAVVTTQPGSKSSENVARFGFAVLYVRAILVKEPS